MDRITPLPQEVRTRVTEFTGMGVINQPESEPAFQFMLQLCQVNKSLNISGLRNVRPFDYQYWQN
jgi:hypothetical protein